MKKFKQGDLVFYENLWVLVTGNGASNQGYNCFAGTVVVPNNNWVLGFYSTTWAIDSFKKLKRKIIIQ